MHIFCTRDVLSDGKIEEYEAIPSTRSESFEVHHATGGISYFYLWEDAFPTREDALANASAKLRAEIQDLEEQKRALEDKLSKVSKFLEELT